MLPKFQYPTWFFLLPSSASFRHLPLLKVPNLTLLLDRPFFLQIQGTTAQHFTSMGLPGSLYFTTDLFPMLLINIIIYVGLIKHALHSFMHLIGLSSVSPRPADITSSLEFDEEYRHGSRAMFSGLTNEVRQGLPPTMYGPDLHFGCQVDTDCHVCLQEFQKGQEVILLPFCRHLFHRACLDPWLDQEHFTCPVCRTSLVPVEVRMRQQEREQEISDEPFLQFPSAHG